MAEFDQLQRQQVLDWLHQQVPLSRVAHILRVEQLAIALAQLHSLNAAQAAQSGLMHDLAKYFKPKILLEMATAAGLPIDPVDQANPHLLHSRVSALVAQQEFQVDDPAILAAIADHTLGRAGMTPLSCVVFLADSLEPGRGDTASLNHLRQISQQNLMKAVWMTCDYTFRYLLDTHQLIHPTAVQTRNWFLQADTRQNLPLLDSSLPAGSL